MSTSALSARVEATIEQTGPDAPITHRELAQVGYGVEDPTPTQLSAVRRVVARLHADGKVDRRRRRFWTELHRPLNGEPIRRRIRSTTEMAGQRVNAPGPATGGES